MSSGDKHRGGGQWGGSAIQEKASKGDALSEETIEHEGIGYVDDLMEGFGMIVDPPEHRPTTTDYDSTSQTRPRRVRASIPKQPDSKTPTETPHVTVPISFPRAASSSQEGYTGKSRDAYMETYVKKDKKKSTTGHSDSGANDHLDRPQT